MISLPFELIHRSQPAVLTLFTVVWQSSAGRWWDDFTFLSFTDLSHTWLDEHTQMDCHLSLPMIFMAGKTWKSCEMTPEQSSKISFSILKSIFLDDSSVVSHHVHTMHIDLVWTVHGCWSSAEILKPACRVVVMTPRSEMSIVCFHVEPLSSKPMQLSDTAHETHWRHHFLSHYLNTNKAFVSSDKHTAVFWCFDCFKCTVQLCWEDAAVRRTRINLIGLGLFMFH